jgi:hypothetical protein
MVPAASSAWEKFTLERLSGETPTRQYECAGASAVVSIPYQLEPRTGTPRGAPTEMRQKSRSLLGTWLALSQLHERRDPVNIQGIVPNWSTARDPRKRGDAKPVPPRSRAGRLERLSKGGSGS